MNRAAVSVVLLGTLGAGFLAGAWYNQREAVSAASVRTRKVLYYIDPMHPAYRSDKPGSAPDCGMQLQPVYAGEEWSSTDVRRMVRAAGEPRVSDEQQQLIGVRIAPVENAAVTETLRLFGRVAVDETRMYRLNIGIEGYVRALAPATTGSLVTKDQWLATISTPEARTPIQSYIVALDVLDRAHKDGESAAAIDFAGAALQQAIDRLLTLGMSNVQIEELKKTRQVPPNITITAPADGFIVQRHVSVGQKVLRGDELYRIADLRRVWVEADAFGAEADYVTPGATANVSIHGRDVSLRARISRDVPPQFDRDSQSAKVRLEIDNPSYVLRPDMFVDVDLPIVLPPAIAVPVDAIIDSGLKRTVFVERRAGVFEPREVETGWRLGGRVQIVKGLSAGERVVVAGAFVVDAERRIRTSSPDDRSRP